MSEFSSQIQFYEPGIRTVFDEKEIVLMLVRTSVLIKRSRELFAKGLKYNKTVIFERMAFVGKNTRKKMIFFY